MDVFLKAIYLIVNKLLSSTLSMETPNHKLFGKHPNDICPKKLDCKNFLCLKHQRKDNFQEKLSLIMFALDIIH